MAPAVAGNSHMLWCMKPMLPKWMDVDGLLVHFSPLVEQNTAPVATSETKSMAIWPLMPV